MENAIRKVSEIERENKVEHRSGCLICGNELIYQDNFEKSECYYCNTTYDANVKCINDHFICDNCHSMSARELIGQFCINSKIEDPIEMALILMRNPVIKMHGPEHHFLVPAVLISCYYNVKKEYDKKEDRIKEAMRRAERIPGGFCGSHGNCGAGVGAGISISVITNATPLSGQEWKLSNLITSKCLLSIAEIGGPRCCKRDTFLSLIEAAEFLNTNFDVKIKYNKNIKCEFSSLNKECIGNRCPFFNKE
jgi:hypothetical protein